MLGAPFLIPMNVLDKDYTIYILPLSKSARSAPGHRSYFHRSCMARWTRRFAVWPRSFEKMNSPNLPDIFLPPVKRDMRDLNRSFFKKTVPLSVATIFEKRDIAKVRTELVSSGDILSIDGIRVTRNDEMVPDRKCMLLNPAVNATGIVSGDTVVYVL